MRWRMAVESAARISRVDSRRFFKSMTASAGGSGGLRSLRLTLPNEGCTRRENTAARGSFGIIKRRSRFGGSVRITFAAFAVVLSVRVAGGREQAGVQISSGTGMKLPASARLSEVEIRWRSDGGDGCAN